MLNDADMSGQPIRWRAVRLAVYCAVVGVAALVLENHTHLHGTHTVVGIDIKDAERQLLGTVAVVLFVAAALLLLGAVVDEDLLARMVSGPALLVIVVTIVGGALVFGAYRVQQNALHKTPRTPPVQQVDCPIKGGTCFNVTGQGGTYPGPPQGFDALANCNWADAGPNPARSEEIYQCR
jgi:hypothetical protein